MATVACWGDPADVLTDIAACINTIVACDRVHYGTEGTGEGLECCDCLLRVEDGGWTPTDLTEGAVTLRRVGGRCLSFTMDVLVIYRTCWTVLDSQGNQIEADTTTQSAAVHALMWDAVRQLGCCTPGDGERNVPACARFVAATPDPPQGGCVGFTIRLRADFQVCDCPEEPS